MTARRSEDMGLLGMFYRDLDRTIARYAEPYDPVALFRRARDGDVEAKHRLLIENAGLVVAVAQRYKRPGVSLDDLTAAGIFGLMRAVDIFDGDRGNDFSSCAYPWIRQSVMRELNRLSRPVHLPRHVVQWLMGYHARRKLTNDDAKPAVTPGSPQAAALAIDNACRAQRRNPRSIDRRATADAYDDREPRTYPALHAALARLPETEGRVIRLLYGIGLDRSRSPAEAAQLLGESRGFVERAKRRAMKRLRNVYYTGGPAAI